MNINLERDTSLQFYHFLVINAKTIFRTNSFMARLECFDGNDIIDVILPKHVGE